MIRIAKDKKPKPVEKKELLAALKRVEEYKDILQRLQAEFENYKKREAKERSRFEVLCRAQSLAMFLPLLDSINEARKKELTEKQAKEGLEMFGSLLWDLLKAGGVQKIDTSGELDPYKHEVVLTRTSDAKEGTILEEVQAGYSVGDMIIRHAKIIVAKNKEENKNE